MRTPIPSSNLSVLTADIGIEKDVYCEDENNYPENDLEETRPHWGSFFSHVYITPPLTFFKIRDVICVVVFISLPIWQFYV